MEATIGYDLFDFIDKDRKLYEEYYNTSMFRKRIRTIFFVTNLAGYYHYKYVMLDRPRLPKASDQYCMVVLTWQPRPETIWRRTVEKEKLNVERSHGKKPVCVPKTDWSGRTASWPSVPLGTNSIGEERML